MIRYWLVCLLLGSLSWSQEISSKSGLAAQESAAPSTATLKTTTSDQGRQPKTSNVAPDAPVITINGLCDTPSADTTTASDCKTVITQAYFEKVINAVQPDMPARARREFAVRYANALVMTKKAEEMGLDKGANYEEQMKIARIQILSKELNKAIQEKASQISDKDVEDYYHNNTANFEKMEMDRIYVPKTRQPPAVFDTKLIDADRQERLKESEQTMKETADNLRARAVDGEDFAKLQANAYQLAGIKSTASNTSVGIRRTSLPANQVSVMDLKPGEVSSVLADPNGYVIYKVKTKEALSLDQVREEIKAILRSQGAQNEMRSIQDSAAPALDESYFRRGRGPQDMLKPGDPAKPASKP